MGFWNRMTGGAAGGDDLFARAQAAYEQGDLNAALTLLSQEAKKNPKNVAAHLLTGQCFVKGGRYPQAFQVYSALVMRPEIRGHAELPTEQVDLLIVEALLAWASRIETTGFADQELALFRKAVNFYGGGGFQGRRTVELVGLDEGLRRKMPVTQTFAAMISAKGQT